MIGLEHVAWPVPWHNVFPVGANGIDSLIEELKKCEFGVFIFAPDDAARMRDRDYLVPRDNVVFEAGLFMGIQVKTRTFIITPKDVASFHLASDFLGITTATYDVSYAKEDPSNALAPAIARIRQILDGRSQSAPSRDTKNRLEIRSYISLGEPAAKLTYPLKLFVEFKNTQSFGAVIEARGFYFGKDVRPSSKAKIVAAAYEFQFFSGYTTTQPKKEIWQKRLTLAPGQSISTWIPIDESTSKAELEARLTEGRIGQLNYHVDWLSDPPVSNDFEDSI